MVRQEIGSITERAMVAESIASKLLQENVDLRNEIVRLNNSREES